MDRIIDYLGIELPEKATLSVLGTSIKIELLAFTTLLQVVLWPVILLWFGSLLNTRAAESLRIANTTDVSQLFPHIVNCYPMVPSKVAKRRVLPKNMRRLALHLGPFAARLSYEFQCLYVALIRASFLSIIIGPPVVALVYSFYLTYIPGYELIYMFAAGILVTFALMQILLEIMPWHYRKIFVVPIRQNIF